MPSTPDEGNKIHVPPGVGHPGRVYAYDPKARSCPECHSIGPPQDGCQHPWHQMGFTYVKVPVETVLEHQFTLGGDLDWAGGLCELHCREDRCCFGCDCPGHQEDGTHITQRRTPPGEPIILDVAKYAGEPDSDEVLPGYFNPIPARIETEPGHPYPTLCGRYGCVLPRGHLGNRPDIPSNHKNDRQARESRCPDGGYCHGSTMAAGSKPCATGHCLRVLTSSPLSGVFPDDRWPEDARQAAKPDGTPLRNAIAQADAVKSCLQSAIGSRDLNEAAAYLTTALEGIEPLREWITQAKSNTLDVPRRSRQGPPVCDD